MNKKLIIMTAAAGLVSFAGMFMLAWFTKPVPERSEETAPQGQSPEVEQSTLIGQEDAMKVPQQQALITSAAGTVESEMKKAMTEKRLRSLVYEVREKIQEYNSKLQDLEIRKQRLQTAQDMLKKDIEELNNLQVELASTVARLKSQQDKLLKSRVEIASTEKNNLISIAATYDKMDSEAAGKILANMSQVQDDSADDAVKILHYMSERTKAKLLAELSTSEPKLAAYFCKKLKHIAEKE